MPEAASKKQIIRWEVGFFLWITLAGGMMHEVYRLSGYWVPIAIIAPVNESISEHMKMVVWPGLLFTVVQYLVMRQRVPNYWLARLMLLLLSCVLNFISFAAYSAIAQSLGCRASPGPAGLLAVLSSIIAQMVCCRMMLANEYSSGSSRAVPAGYLFLTVAFSTFSYFPPKIYLFEHHDNYRPNGQYGLAADREQSPRNENICEE